MGNTFNYTYSAKENAEILEIRKKYLPRGESKLDELKRLDNLVQAAGTVESLCAGILGALVFGVGFCLCAEVIGSGLFMQILGVLIGLIGSAGMIAAYPLYRKISRQAKEKHASRILELAAELTGEKTSEFNKAETNL